MKWSDCTMLEAIQHASGRVARTNDDRPEGAYVSASVVWFTDGTAIECSSAWDGPYSAETPDVCANDPEWRIFR